MLAGGVQCWGANFYGQLGDGTTTIGSTPVQAIAAGSGVTALAAGDSHTCAAVAGGAICFGHNNYAQLTDASGSLLFKRNAALLGAAAPPTIEGTLNPLLRLYNPALQTHLYTTDYYEYTILATLGWSQDGEVGKVLTAGSKVLDRPTIAVYRLYSGALRKHLLTTDLNEYNVLGANGWSKEGAIGYVADQPSTNSAVVTVPLTRLYNSITTRHLFSTDPREISFLSTVAGWNLEGALGYLLK